MIPTQLEKRFVGTDCRARKTEALPSGWCIGEVNANVHTAGESDGLTRPRRSSIFGRPFGTGLAGLAKYSSFAAGARFDASRNNSKLATVFASDMLLAGRLHPLLVHFPIGLVLLAAGAELVATLAGRETSHTVAVANVAGLSRFRGGSGNRRLADGSRATGSEASGALEWHRWLAIAATAVTSLAAATTIPRSSRANRWIHRALLFAAEAAVAITAHFGGILVWGADFLHL
jgi:uncharacterized membrane protein